MKWRRLLSTITICTVVVWAWVLPAAEDDHLFPVDRKEFARYREILQSKLCATPFDYGRSILQPPFQGEVCVSVYETSKHGQQIYQVSCASAEQNLYQRTDAAHHPENAKAVTVQRVDAEIPERTAKLLKEVWTRMLEGPHGPKPSSQAEWRTISVDGTIMEWSLERPSSAPLYGLLDISLPYPGENTKLLVDISNALYQYCQLPRAKRAAIATQIERSASRLLANLKTQ